MKYLNLLTMTFTAICREIKNVQNSLIKTHGSYIHLLEKKTWCYYGFC